MWRPKLQKTKCFSFNQILNFAFWIKNLLSFNKKNFTQVIIIREKPENPQICDVGQYFSSILDETLVCLSKPSHIKGLEYSYLILHPA